MVRPYILNNITGELLDSCNRFAQYSTNRRKKQYDRVDEPYKNQLTEAFFDLHGIDLAGKRDNTDWKWFTLEDWQKVAEWIVYLEKEVGKLRELDHSILRGEMEMKNGKG